MKSSDMGASDRQQEYYRLKGGAYDQPDNDEQIDFALYLLEGFLRRQKISSILEIGAGAGRAFLEMNLSFPEIDLTGIEPSDALREVGYKKGIPREKLLPGDGNKLNFSDDTFDLVTEFAVLHHVPNPRRVVTEMARVARQSVSWPTITVGDRVRLQVGL